MPLDATITGMNQGKSEKNTENSNGKQMGIRA
jgi:hypothetical protein